LFVHGATAGGPGSFGSTEQLALQLTVLTDHEGGPPPSHAEHQTEGAEVAILDPELILLDELEYLGDQAALLRMAILAQHDIGDQHALLV
jgi:hypothetical protein